MVLYKLVTCQPHVQAGRLAGWHGKAMPVHFAGYATMLVSSKAKECGKQLHIWGKGMWRAVVLWHSAPTALLRP